jgi:hypothetical protein
MSSNPTAALFACVCVCVCVCVQRLLAVHVGVIQGMHVCLRVGVCVNVCFVCLSIYL